MTRTMTCPDDFDRVFNFICLCLLISEPHALDYFAVANEHGMFLLPCISAELVSRVHGKIDKIAGDSFAALTQIGWSWFPIPLNARAIWVNQLFVQPLHDDLLIVGRVRAIPRGVC